MKLVFQPSIPLALWVLLALCAAVLLIWYSAAARRHLRGLRWAVVVGLMTVGLAAPLAVLLNPHWLERIPPPGGKPRLTVLVDRSASMGTRDVGERQRFAAAAECAAEVARKLGERFDVQVRSFAHSTSPQTAESLLQLRVEGDVTDIVGAVEDAIDAQWLPGQALLLLSDGAHNAPGGSARLRDAAAKARAMAAPVFCRTFGGATEVRDLEIELKSPQQLAFVGQELPIAAVLRQRGQAAQRATVTLSLAGKEMDRTEVPFDTAGRAETTFRVSQKARGLYRYDVRLEPVPGEVTEVNNHASFVLRVVDQPVRVLLLEGKPYWDTKFLVRSLSLDPSIDLTSVVRLKEGRLLERRVPRRAAVLEKPEAPVSEKPDNSAESSETSKKPVSEKPANPGPATWNVRTDVAALLADPETLAQYQVIVLGREADVFLSDEALARLKKWIIESEGALVCFRGPPTAQINQRLGELMPVRWSPSGESRFRMQLTAEGQALRWLPTEDASAGVVQMPALVGMSRVEAPKPLAVVLANAALADGSTQPIVTYQPVGGGRVVVIEGAGMWRWAFLPPDHQALDDVYSQFWRSLMRWLVSNVGLLPSQRLALRTDKVTFGTAENVTATLLLRPEQWKDGPPLVSLAGDSKPVPATYQPVALGSELGQYRVSFGELKEGRYTARVADAAADEVSAETAFDVRGSLKERLDVAAEPNLMKLVAEGSGGAGLDDGDPLALADRFEQHLAKTRPERIAQTPAWDRWWLLGALFCVWAALWSLRRASGLV